MAIPSVLSQQGNGAGGPGRQVPSTKQFFSPANAQIYGVANILGETKIQLLNDIQQITFSTPVDIKPVLSLGQREQHGYTYGQRLYAGTIQVPANSFPSFYQLFTNWFETLYNISDVSNKPDSVYLNVNAEDLPLFDILIISIPETARTLDVTNVFLYVIKNVKIIETSVDLNTQQPSAQVMLYRFAQSYIGQKLALIKSNDSGKLTLNLDDLLSIYNLFEEKDKYQKFTDLAINTIY